MERAFASGHGLIAGHDRFRYDVRREEMSAEGFADLWRRLACFRFPLLICFSYFSTEWRLVASTEASSFTRIGRLPVCSSCLIVPITISSLIPSTSTLLSRAGGEGGGDSSCACFDRMAVDLGGLIDPVEVFDRACDVLEIFAGRSDSSPSTIVFGGEGCDCVRLRLGMATPRSGNESETLRVL